MMVMSPYYPPQPPQPPHLLQALTPHPHNVATWQGLLLSPFYTRGSERLSDLPEVTQLARDAARMPSRAAGSSVYLTPTV